MSVKYIVSLFVAALIGFTISLYYSHEVIPALEARIAALEALLADVTRGNDPNTGQVTLTFTNMNVQIVNGNTTIGDTNGRGNLIIGYNALRGDGDDRTGSHMLVIGDENNYTADSFGGMVVGLSNETAADYASVSGGTENTASGDRSSVSGGRFNIASFFTASVSGGYRNEASGADSSVSGGTFNEASGVVSSVSGGLHNTASNEQSSVSGGSNNTASGDRSSVSGGYSKNATGAGCWEGDTVEDC